MLQILNDNITSPVRKILGKAELYNSSAITKSGENLVLNDVAPIRHNIKAQFFQPIEDNNFKINESVYDYIDWKKKQSVKRVGVVDLGTLAWVYTTKYERFDAELPADIRRADYLSQNALSELAYNNSVYFDASRENGYCISYNKIFIRNLDYTDATAFKTAMAGVMLYYELAEPIITDFSPFGNTEVKVLGVNLFDYETFLTRKSWEKQIDGSYFNNGRQINEIIWNNTNNISGSMYLSVSTKHLKNNTAPFRLMVKYTDGQEVIAISIGYDEAIEVWKYRTYVTNANKTVSSITWTYGANCNFYIKNLLISFYSLDYEPYKGKTYTTDENGNIENIISISPVMNFIEPVGAIVTAEYNAIKYADTFSYNDSLQSITIDRVGEGGKFFGFGVSQKLNLKLRDTERLINTTTKDRIKVYFGTDQENYINNYPLFFITQTNRDENTNALSITAYDCIKDMEKHTVAELGLTSYTVKAFAAAAADLFGLSLDIQGVEDFTLFNLEYAEGANFEGAESIREALTAVAEATQTIYFVTGNKLVFKRLSILPAAAITIDKENYISLDSGENRRLKSICSTNELGDATTASISANGTTQFIRDNPFLELREDIADILDNAIAAVGGTTINQFSCSWRGNYLVEIGDKLGLITKDNETVYSYLLNDTINYNGAFSEETQWSYTDNDNETASNPTTLGETLKNTFAKVDKANKQINIVASETATNSAAISALQINTESINASVEKISKESTDALGAVNEDISALKTKVEAQITADDVTIEIKKELANGTAKVETSTGFTFDEEGLSVSKSGSEMSTKITDDGMKITKNNKEVLTANNEGVKAIDLHAITYLIVGTNSRFENYGNDRTGCFWIGG